MSPHDPRLLADLRQVVGSNQVLDDPELVASYVVDWTGRFRGPTTTVVVRPGSVSEVAAVVARCRRDGVALVPQGGNTGMVGGGVPLSGELVLNLRRLARMDDVDQAAGQVTVGSGTTLGDVRRAAAAAGWAYGVDFAARDSATIGGNIGTNAGGSTGTPLRRHPGPGARCRSRAGVRRGGLPSGWPDEGQHRLRPAFPPLRQ